MLIIQLCLYCALFTILVYLFTWGKAVNVLYFYPKPVRERAFEIGLADRATTSRRRACFLIWFPIWMLTALLIIIGVWNGVRDFKTAYLQALLFLEVANWYDGIIIDRLWVGHSRFWILPGAEDLPFVKPWKFVLTRRGLGMFAWAAAAAGVAALVVRIF